VFKSPTYSANANCYQLSKIAISRILSCYGVNDYLNPSNSSLLLSDWETSPLIVADINALELTNTQVAYLSTCYASSNSTGSPGREHASPDPFQMAEFPRVIGTLWQVDDQRSGVVSRTVLWDTILKADGTLEFEKAAEGLHHPVRVLREQTR